MAYNIAQLPQDLGKLKKGSRCILHFGSLHKIEEVDRKTPTQIILKNGKKFRVNDGKPVGKSYRSSNFIRPIDQDFLDADAIQANQKMYKATARNHFDNYLKNADVHELYRLSVLLRSKSIKHK